MPESTEVSAAAAQDYLRDGAILLDVREDYEWADGHAPQAVHIPMGEIGGRVDEIPKDKTIVCVCHIGGRSARVAEALNGAGWVAMNLIGGMEAWERAGFPVVQP